MDRTRLRRGSGAFGGCGSLPYVLVTKHAQAWKDDIPANIVILSMSPKSPYPSPSNAAHRSATRICARFRKRTFFLSNVPSSLKHGNFSASRFTNLAAEFFASSINVTTLLSNSCHVSHQSLISSNPVAKDGQYSPPPTPFPPPSNTSPVPRTWIFPLHLPTLNRTRSSTPHHCTSPHQSRMSGR